MCECVREIGKEREREKENEKKRNQSKAKQSKDRKKDIGRKGNGMYERSLMEFENLE